MNDITIKEILYRFTEGLSTEEKRQLFAQDSEAIKISPENAKQLRKLKKKQQKMKNASWRRNKK